MATISNMGARNGKFPPEPGRLVNNHLIIVCKDKNRPFSDFFSTKTGNFDLAIAGSNLSRSVPDSEDTDKVRRLPNCHGKFPAV
jgi:hypothetical protein